MLLPTYWLRKRTLDRLLSGYPVYDPPFKTVTEGYSSQGHAENFAYFNETRSGRVSAFRSALSLPASGGQSDAELAALMAWGERHAGMLIEGDPAGEAFFTFASPWTGKYAALNLLCDLATCLAEQAKARLPKAHWSAEWLPSRRATHGAGSEPEGRRIVHIERDVQCLRSERPTKYEWPLLVLPERPEWQMCWHESVFQYAMMMRHLVIAELALRHLGEPKAVDADKRGALRQNFQSALTMAAT